MSQYSEERIFFSIEWKKKDSKEYQFKENFKYLRI